MNKDAAITVHLPQKAKELIFAKYVGEGMVSAFIRNLLQRRFIESNVMLCLECGNDQIDVEQREDYTRYCCKKCNNQVALDNKQRKV